MNSKKKAIISACLLGEICRYDGKSKQVNEVIEAFTEYEIIPFCPEAPLFGTPRQRISVVVINGKNRVITDETNEDVTQMLQDEIDAFIKQNPHADIIVLKSKSPSCGLGTTPILNEKKEVVAYLKKCPESGERFSHFGNGIAADIFSKEYPHAKIVDELEFKN
ncbi:MAG: DUF523 domain-containing protein [Campylobacterales bacterium]|nr:DUF523 domain-containing protein [Campylobacterales bacterium]